MRKGASLPLDHSGSNWSHLMTSYLISDCHFRGSRARKNTTFKKWPPRDSAPYPLGQQATCSMGKQILILIELCAYQSRTPWSTWWRAHPSMPVPNESRDQRRCLSHSRCHSSLVRILTVRCSNGMEVMPLGSWGHNKGSRPGHKPRHT